MRLFRQPEHIYALRKPDYQENRDGRWLHIWKDIPHWLVVDTELHNLLNELDGLRSLDEILDLHPNWIPMRDSILAGIRAMEESGVVKSTDTISERKPSTSERAIPIENVSLNITRRCNLQCKFCYNLGFPEPDSEKELSAKQIWHFLRRLRPMLGKKPSLTILGGEPLLRPDDLLLLGVYTKQAGFETLVSTNGTLITESFAKQAALIGLQMQVSLDGHNAELHDAVRGDGAFNKAIEGIKRMIQHKVYTTISMVCHKENLLYLEEFYDLAKSLGVNEARFIPLKCIGGGIDGGFSPVSTFEMLKVSFDLFKRRPDLLQLAGRDAFSIIANTCKYSITRKSCGTGLQTLLLDSDGSIYPCLNTNLPEFRLANICDADFDFPKMWHHSAQLGDFRKQTAVTETDGVCFDCVARHWCFGGCRGETYISTGNIKAKPMGCADMRESIIEMMWMIAEKPDIVKSTNASTHYS